MNIKTLFPSLLILTILTACGATGPTYQSLDLTTPENSVIYIYRPSHFVGAASYPEITLDEKHLGSLKNGGYLVKEISPGKHKLTTKGNAWNYALAEKTIMFEAMPGESKYARYLINASVSAVVGTVVYINSDNAFHFVKPEYARKEINQLQLSK